MKYEKIYQKLKEKYTNEEITESMLLPADLTKEEKENAHTEMMELRMKHLKETTQDDRILSDVMRLRFLMEDYLKEDHFSFEKTFGKYLEEYIRIIRNRSNIVRALRKMG